MVKKPWLLAIVILGLVSNAVCSSAPSLLPFDSRWAAADIRALIASGADVSALDEWGQTALMWAASESDDPDVVVALIAAGADLNRVNRWGDSPLMCAVNTKPENALVLIGAGADVNIANHDGDTALIRGTWGVITEEVFEALIRAGAALDAENTRGDTALDRAIRGSMPGIAALLIAGGANMKPHNVNDLLRVIATAMSQDYDPRVVEILVGPYSEANGFTQEQLGLFIAAATGREPESMGTHVSVGGPVDMRDRLGRTPLMMSAAYNWDPDMVKVLIDIGANVGAQDSNGVTALMHAILGNRSLEIVEALLEAGADVNAEDVSGTTALMYAMKREVSEGIARALISAGADVNARDDQGKTILMYAVERSYMYGGAVWEALIEAGADTGAVSDEGKTVLDYARRGRRLSVDPRFPVCLQVLLDPTAGEGGINARDDRGRTSLMLAVAQGKGTGVIEELISLGADVDASDHDGMTALMLAVSPSIRDIEVVSVLMKAGADAGARDNSGKTALVHAVEYGPGDVRIVKALLDADASGGFSGLSAYDYACSNHDLGRLGFGGVIERMLAEARQGKYDKTKDYTAEPER